MPSNTPIISNIKVKNKRDTLANWTSNNPTPLNGELAIVDDNNNIKIKVGNGVDSFIALPYIKSDSSAINAMTGYSKPNETSAITTSDTLNSAIGKLEKAIDNAGGGGGLQPGNVNLSTNSVTLTSRSPTATVILSNATGNVSLVYSAGNFSASINNNTITINRTGIDDEYGIILITVEANQTYTALTLGISVYNEGVRICTWADGSDDDITSMLVAAHNGDINLADYWAVGDTRTITNLNTSTISDSTITLKLYSGVSYDDTDSSKISTFKIIPNVERTNLSVDNFLPSYYSDLKFNVAQQFISCLPKYIKNNLLTQKRIYNSNNDTIDTKISYAGNYISEFLSTSSLHSSDSEKYVSNGYYYLNYAYGYYCYYSYKNYEYTLRKGNRFAGYETNLKLAVRYLMCI